MDKSYITSNGNFTLQIMMDSNNDSQFDLPTPNVEGYVIGRSDQQSSYLPDIDLTDFGGRQQGISRRHAVLVQHMGIVHILDLDSLNGTYVNGQRLEPMVAFALQSEDELMFASLRMKIL